HTRFSRDWSSDVCSSDLKPAAGVAGGPEQLLEAIAEIGRQPVVNGEDHHERPPTKVRQVRTCPHESSWYAVCLRPISHFTIELRSEERRVGKACRCGRAG